MDTKDKAGKETRESDGLNWRRKSRKTYTGEQRLAMVQQCLVPGVSIAEVALRNGVNTNLLFRWKKLHDKGLRHTLASSAALVPVRIAGSAPVKAARVVGADRRVPGGAIEIQVGVARVYVHGGVSEADLAMVLRALSAR